MADKLYSFSPKPKRNTTKRRLHLSTKRRKKPKHDPPSVHPENQHTTTAGSSGSSAEESEVNANTAEVNQFQRIEDRLLDWETKQNLIYGGAVNRHNAPDPSTQDVFASARLLEMAQSTQPTVPRGLNANNLSLRGFVALTDHSPCPPFLQFGSQMPITNTQLSRICTEADLAQCSGEATSNPNQPYEEISTTNDQGPYWNISPIPKPARVLTTKESILEDFGVNSPEPPSQQLVIESPIPVLRKNIQKTYSRCTDKPAQSSRALFEPRDRPDSNSSASELDDNADESESEAFFHSCRDSRIAIVTTPPPDLNLSGCVLNNLMNLSFYYSQNQGEPEYEPKDIIPDNSQKTAADKIAMDILENQSSAMATILSGDSDSFYGFGESITIRENFDIRMGDFDDEPQSQINESADEMKLVQNLSSFLQDDDDIFAEIESPVKATNARHQGSPKKLCVPTENIPNQIPSFSGFSTGLGSKIHLPRIGKNIFKDEQLDDLSLCNRPMDFMTGFSTGNGTHLSIPGPSKGRKIFVEEPLEDILAPISRLSHNDMKTSKTDTGSGLARNGTEAHVGFSTGRGTKIVICEKALAKTSKIFDRIDESENLVSKHSMTSIAQNLASKMDHDFEVPIHSKSIAGEFKKHLDSSTPKAVSSFNGFTTGRGAKNQEPDKTTMKRSNIFEDFDMELRTSDYAIDDELFKVTTLNEFSDGTPNRVDNPKSEIQKNKHKIDMELDPEVILPKLGGFSTGRGSAISISEQAIKKSMHIFNENNVENNSTDTPLTIPSASTPLNIASINTSTPKPTAGFCTSRGGFITVSNQSLKRSRKLFEDNEVSRTPGYSNISSHVALQTPDLIHTPVNKPQSFTQEITASTKALLEDEMFSMGNDTCPSTKAFAAKSRVWNAKPTRLFSQLEEIVQENLLDEVLGSSNTITCVPPSIRSARIEAMAAQQRAIADKKDVKLRPGALYLMKLLSTQIKFKDFVQNQKPRNQESPDLSLQVRSVSIENVKNFKFDLSAEDLNIVGITLSDGIQVIADENNRIGLTELTYGFLSSDSIDPKLLHPDWVSQHWSMIIIKLAAMETAFPSIFAGQTLTPENVMLQLKFRYDKEIDRAERSILRKILEMDDVASRRMVLFVLKVWSDQECELSDGHYGVRTILDPEMGRLFRARKVVVGTKLMVQGAELIGLEEGCAPLEVPPTVRLKISTNSTRRVRWFAKLGAFRAPEPFTISLSSVLPNGGRIGCLNVCVLRVYTMLYVDKTRQSGKGTVLRSERVQKRFETNNVQELETIERLYSQVSREYDKEEQSKKKTSATKNQRISDDTEVSQLFDMLQNANDPEAVEDQLTSAQKNELRAFQARQIDLRADAINQRVREKLSSDDRSKRKVTPLLKLRIIDSAQPSSTAMLSIWSPHESLVETLRESRFIQICNASASGIRYNELQLSAGRNTNFKLVPTGVHRQDLERKCTKIAAINQPKFKPPFNELDTIGLVVKVSESTTRKFQPVFLVDESLNLLCVNFWAGLKSFAYEDLVKVGRFLAVRDVQWRTINSNQSIPCTFATEFTSFTEHPKFVELSNELETLRAKIPNVDGFIQRALQKIESASLAQKSAKASCPMTPKTPFNRNQSATSTELLKTPAEFSPGVGQPTSQVQCRLEKLSSYGDAPVLSSIVLNDSSPLNRRLKRQRTSCTSADDIRN